MSRRSLGLLAAIAAVATMLLAVPALAAPVTVNLRIEGPTRTLFEGPVTTDVRTFHFSNSSQTYECDGTSANQGSSATAVPTRGAVFTQAEEQAPFSATGSFSASLGSPSFDTIDGESVAYDPSTNDYLVEYKNAVAAQVGSCADPVSSGDDVLFAYGNGSEQLLKLAGPATARPGDPVALKVTDAANGAPVQGAQVDGHASGADGTVTVGPYDARGDHDLKASKPGAIRSNRVRVCVSDGSDGACGTTASTPKSTPPCATTGDDGLCGTRDTHSPLGTITSIRDGRHFTRRHAPRTLAGVAFPDPSGIARVRLRLTRTDAHHRCTTFDARRERFARERRCGAARGRWFRIPTAQKWSYLLPARLPVGRYVLDLKVTDGAGNAETVLHRNRTRVVFVVT
ncbi:MAG: hypothetical protein ACXVFK_05545 [Solirubrobacteraceae bacterium]